MFEQRSELVFLEEVCYHRVIVEIHSHVLFLHVQDDVGLDGDQVMAHLYMSFCIQERLSLLRCEFIDVPVYILYIVIFSNKFSCSDLSYALYSRHIVR